MALTRLRMDELVSAWVGDRATPFQIALVGLAEAGPFRQSGGTLDVARIRAELIRRAHRVPQLRQRVVWTRPAEGRPVWAEDPSFDPARHVEVASLPAGADFVAWAANEIVRPLDPDRPLWRAEVVDGLPGDRFGLLVVVHHIVADGRTGMAIAAALFDPQPSAAVPDPPPHAVPPLPGPWELLADRVHTARAALGRAPSSLAGLPARLRSARRQARDAAADFRTRTAGTSLPRRVGPGRRLAVVQQPLEELRRTGHALGVTVNDLLLAAVAGGLRDLLLARGDDVAGLLLHTSVPVGARGPGQADGMLVVALPMGEPDPLRRLALISATTSARKQRLQAGGGDVLDVLHLPTPVAHLAVRWMRRIAGGRVNLFVTNVPGPAAPLWLAGARVTDAVPVAPVVRHVPLGVAALSYAGTLSVSMNADAAIAELDVLADGVRRSFAALHEAARAGRPIARPDAAAHGAPAAPAHL